MKLVRTPNGRLALDDGHYFSTDDFMGFMAEEDWGEQSYQKIFAYIEEHGPSMLPELIERKKGDYWGVAQSLICRACMDIDFDVGMKLVRAPNGRLALDDQYYFTTDDFNRYLPEEYRGEESYQKIFAYIEEHGPAMLPALIKENAGTYWGVARSLIIEACMRTVGYVTMPLERDSDGDLCLDGNNFFERDEIDVHMFIEDQCEKSYEMVWDYIEKNGPAMLPELILKNEGDRRSIALSLIHEACSELNLG